MSKTTAAHFADFCSCVDHWQVALGLTDYSINIVHEKSHNDYASCTPNVPGRVATINLATIWDGDKKVTHAELDKTALHEVLHLLLAELSWLGECRFLGPDDIEPAEHAVVRRLEHLLGGMRV